MNYPVLFSPMKIGNIQIKNRIVMPAMGVNTAEYDGRAGNDLAVYYEERAKGGVGLIITEITRVNEKDAVTQTRQLSMSDDIYIKPFQKVVERVHAHGAKIFVQLHHPGRQNVVFVPTVWNINEKLACIIPGYWKLLFRVLGKTDTSSSMDDPKTIKLMNKYMKPLLAPSEVPSGLGVNPIRNQRTVAMTQDQISTLVKQFVTAAKRVQKSGADGVELHASHGYLLQQFLSPYTNRRTDKYGGSLENRMRIVREIIEGIQKVCGNNFPIIVRLTVDEYYETIGYPDQGIHLEEGVEMAKMLESFGVAALNISSGNYDTGHTSVEPMSYAPGWRKNLARAVKDAVCIPVIAANVIRTPQQAEQQLTVGDQDFIAIGRPLLADPNWANKAKTGASEDILRCISCLRCADTLETNMLKGAPIEWALQPTSCREAQFDKTGPQDGNHRQVIIVGAGPAGLTAARELACRGFKVTVLEKESEPGGQLLLAKVPPHKEKIGWAITDLTRLTLNNGAEIIYNTVATKELIDSYNPYAVIVATGGIAAVPKIPGADADDVTTPTPILKGEVTYTQKRIAVVGSGMTGLETAEVLACQGNDITIVEMSEKLAPGANLTNAFDVIRRLEKAGVRFMTGRKLDQIKDGKLFLSKQNGVLETLSADVVVLALGTTSCNQLAKELEGKFQQLYVIGDASKTGSIGDATRSAFLLARQFK